MGAGAGGKFGNTQGKRSSAKIHKGKQDKHIEGTNNYNQQRANGKNPSILTKNAEELLREGAGKGTRIGINKEVVNFGKPIGKFYDVNSGKYYDTSRGTIHYDRDGGAHIVPAMPSWMFESKR